MNLRVGLEDGIQEAEQDEGVRHMAKAPSGRALFVLAPMVLMMMSGVSASKDAKAA
jgi:hypothetical protein